MNYQIKVERQSLEDESAPSNCNVNVYGNSLQLTAQCTKWNNEESCGAVVGSSEYEKAK